MLIIKVNATSFGVNRFEGKFIDENTKRVDTFKSKNENLTEEDIIKRIINKYVGTLVQFDSLVSIETSNQDFDKYFANMGGNLIWNISNIIMHIHKVKELVIV